MKGPARITLIVLRSIQVAISLAVSLILAWVMAGSVLAWHYVREYFTVRDYHDQQTFNTYTKVFAGVLAGSTVLLTFAVLSFVLTLTWLVFTASNRARARAHCIGNHVLCARYTCDMAWDIVLIFYWALLLVLASVAAAVVNASKSVNVEFRLDDSSDGYTIGSRAGPSDGGRFTASVNPAVAYSPLVGAMVALSALMLMSLVATAALSSAIRNRHRRLAHPVADEETSSDHFVRVMRQEAKAVQPKVAAARGERADDAPVKPITASVY